MKLVYNENNELLGVQFFKNGGVENWFGSAYLEFLKIKEEALSYVSTDKESLIMGYEYQFNKIPTEYELLSYLIEEIILFRERKDMTFLE